MDELTIHNHSTRKVIENTSYKSVSIPKAVISISGLFYQSNRQQNVEKKDENPTPKLFFISHIYPSIIKPLSYILDFFKIKNINKIDFYENVRIYYLLTHDMLVIFLYKILLGSKVLL